ncbi:MAG: SDR family oxidoreductase [Hyphomicrobiaceae bacterium]|nr:SDR family oxidoreductase [Hyphomicrobiaceae bacterium]
MANGDKPRVAVVTGGSRGIGAAVVAKLAARGLQCLNLDRDPPREKSAAEYFKIDLTDATAAARVLAQVTEAHDVLWLVNNAGMVAPASLEETMLEDFERVMNLNLRALIQCTQAVLPAMKRAHFGRVVNISSRAAQGKELRTVYAASKAGVLGLTRTWSLELGKHGITVNAVGPGPIATDLFMAVNPADSPRTKAIINGVPVKRLGTPDDVAHAVDFFLSDAASFVTGQTLYVCGGMTVGFTAE